MPALLWQINKNKQFYRTIVILVVLLDFWVISQPSIDPILKAGKRIIRAQQIKDFKQKLNGRSLEGKWQCIEQLFHQPSECFYFNIPINPSNQINLNDNIIEPQPFFKHTNNGTMQGFFWSTQDDKLIDRLYLLLYRQKHRTKKAIEFNLQLDRAQQFRFQADRNQTRLILYKQEKLISTVSLFDKEQELVKFDITMDIEIFISADNFQTYQSSPSIPAQIPLEIRVFSESINFGSNIQYVSYKNIVEFLLFICVIQVVFILMNPSVSKQNAQKNRSVMFRISQWLILQMYAFIFFLCKLYIKLALRYFDTELGYLIYIGILNIGIGMIFLRKYETILEKFTNKWMLFMAALFSVVYFILAHFYIYSPFFWIVEISIMMQLQILHSMINGGKGGLPIDLLGYMVFSRIPFIYIFTTTDNIFKLPPFSGQIITLLLAVFILLWGVIYLQSKKGGQFMIPNELIPGFYNYYYFQSADSQNMNEQCPICTTQISIAPDSTVQMTEVQSSVSSNLQAKQNQYSHQIEDTISKMTRFMKTPCGHNFHIDCLTKWMQAKLVCPYCRKTLPQLASLQKQ